MCPLTYISSYKIWNSRQLPTQPRRKNVPQNLRLQSPLHCWLCREEKLINKDFLPFLKRRRDYYPAKPVVCTIITFTTTYPSSHLQKKLQREHGEIIIPTTTAAATATYKDANITSLPKKIFHFVLLNFFSIQSFTCMYFIKPCYLQPWKNTKREKLEASLFQLVFHFCYATVIFVKKKTFYLTKKPGSRQMIFKIGFRASFSSVNEVI